MDENVLNDLKQFITATVSQATAELSKDINELSKDMEKVKRGINDLDLKVDTISEALHENLRDHESRITKLEQQIA